MNILCKILGHKVVGYLYKDSNYHRYFKITSTETDGLGVEHAHLLAECSRCGVEFYIGKVHLPKNTSNLIIGHSV